jgi:hypothetical protein
MFTTINTFESIIIDEKKKTLVICDIDNTILYQKPEQKIEFFYKMVRDDFEDMLSEEEIIKETNDFYQMAINMATPKCTDFQGFLNLEKKIKNLNGKIIFLTARNIATEKYTQNQFSKIGLDHKNYQIHYTNNTISKGEYIKNNIDLSPYDDIIFIDDYECYISIVKNLNKNITCYKFVLDKVNN